MSELQIKRITTKRELKDFVRFNYEMYKDCPYAVPDFLEDTLDTFNKDYNAAFEFCDADWFLAYRDGKIVGRVAAIINNRANQKWGTRNVRFGWIDFIDDLEVCRTLINTVEQWGKERGMDTIVGPLGFTDLDQEGMLFEGYDQMGSMYTMYNYPYYNEHLKTLGFEEDAVCDPTVNLAAYADAPCPKTAPTRTVADNETLRVGDIDIKVLYTPGHTVGSTCYYTEGMLFSGDTLFLRNIGRCDLPGGDFDIIKESIRRQLYILPDDTDVYPGHGRTTTIGYEKKNNEYIQQDWEYEY